MKGGAHPSPFAALSFPNSKKGTHFLLGWQREFSSLRMAQRSLELTRYGDFLHHSRAALTTRPRRLSQWALIGFPRKQWALIDFPRNYLGLSIRKKWVIYFGIENEAHCDYSTLHASSFLFSSCKWVPLSNRRRIKQRERRHMVCAFHLLCQPKIQWALIGFPRLSQNLSLPLPPPTSRTITHTPLSLSLLSYGKPLAKSLSSKF